MAYTTIQGDTWDNIALKIYGKENYVDFLMKNNYKYLDIVIFDSGVILNTPELINATDEGLPPWRTVDEKEDEDPYDEYEEEDE